MNGLKKLLLLKEKEIGLTKVDKILLSAFDIKDYCGEKYSCRDCLFYQGEKGNTPCMLGCAFIGLDFGEIVKNYFNLIKK